MAKKRRSKGARDVDPKAGEEPQATASIDEQPAAQKATQGGANGVNKNRSFEEVRPKG